MPAKVSSRRSSSWSLAAMASSKEIPFVGGDTSWEWSSDLNLLVEDVNDLLRPEPPGPRPGRTRGASGDHEFP